MYLAEIITFLTSQGKKLLRTASCSLVSPLQHIHIANKSKVLPQQAEVAQGVPGIPEFA
jgi:hypothetical protein